MILRRMERSLFKAAGWVYGEREVICGELNDGDFVPWGIFNINLGGVKTNLHQTMSSNTMRYAERELQILSKSATDPDNRPIIEEFIPEILALCDKFGNSGQSGGSAPYTAAALSQAIKKLCLQEPICPVMNLPEEWVDVSRLGDGVGPEFQNARCGCLFKDGLNGRPYYLDAIVWKGEEDGDAFIGTVEGYRSRQYVKSFPFEPKTFYIDVVREELPEDWDQEPFIEGKDWYDTAEFERTGIKNWHKYKYRSLIKDKSQLERVFKYYDRFE